MKATSHNNKLLKSSTNSKEKQQPPSLKQEGIVRTPVTREVPEVASEHIEALRKMFPQVFIEGKIDVEKLRSILGDEGETRQDKFTFWWAGKRNALQIVQMPTRATLVPAKDESVDFDTSENVFIEGDNLEVMKLLHKPYFGKVKMIYIDPPYNTGNDFVYADNYADPLNTYLRITGQRDAEGNILSSNPETSGRYHSAWLSMMYPRLFFARQLLTDDGVIFVSIDDHEVHNLRMLMNEVFGEENFIAQITVLTNPKGRVLREHFARSHDYLLVYCRSAPQSELSVAKSEEEIAQQYSLTDERGSYRLLELRNTHRRFGRFNRPNLYYPLYIDPKDGSVHINQKPRLVKVFPNWEDGFEGCWTWGKEKVARDKQLLVGKQVNGAWKIFRKAYAADASGQTARKKLQTIWTEKEYQTEKGQSTFDELIPGGVFQSPKPVGLIRTLLLLCNDPEAIVLDFFAGSCSTAHAVLELNREDGGNRRFIMVQLQEPTPEDSNARKAGFKTIAEIGEERVRCVIARLKKVKKSQLGVSAQTEDLGFRIFKLAESNYKPWKGIEDKNPEEYAAEMEGHIDSFVDDWKEEDVIYEVAIKEGFGLTIKMEREKKYRDNEIWRVIDPEKGQSLLICLDDKIKASTIRNLEVTKNDVFVCRDVALDDTGAANLALQCNLKTI